MGEAAERLARLRQRATDQRLVVLVWGPGDPGPGRDRALYEKRVQTRDALQRTFRLSEVYFSEDAALRSEVADLPDVLDEEYAEATVADVIIVFDTSRGAHVEVDSFSSHPHIASKMHVFLPEEYVGSGLAREVHEKVASVVPFSPDDLRVCNAKSRAEAIVMAAAIRRCDSFGY